MPGATTSATLWCFKGKRLEEFAFRSLAQGTVWPSCLLLIHGRRGIQQRQPYASKRFSSATVTTMA